MFRLNKLKKTIIIFLLLITLTSVFKDNKGFLYLYKYLFLISELNLTF